MSGAEAGVLVIMGLWVTVIVCWSVSAYAERRKRRHREELARQARDRRRSEAPYQWPKHRGVRQEFGTPAPHQPAYHSPAWAADAPTGTVTSDFSACDSGSFAGGCD